jgi:hypothetical protein
MPNRPTGDAHGEADRRAALARAVLDALVESTLCRDLDGLRRPRVVAGTGSPLRLHGEGISACPSCGGPRRVHRIAEAADGTARRSHFCARCWQLDLVDRDGSVCARANRRLERLVRELPVAARLTSLAGTVARPPRRAR